MSGAIIALDSAAMAGFGGRPIGRKVLSSPMRRAARLAQLADPSGCPRRTERRTRPDASNFLYFVGSGEDFREKNRVQSGRLAFAGDATFGWVSFEQT